MKRSKLRNNWQRKRLGEMCQIEIGKTPARANKKFWDTEKQTKNVWLSIADLLNSKDNIVIDSKEYISDKGVEVSKIVKKGTLLASFKLTLGRLAFAGKDLYTNEAIAALSIRDEKEISKEFLFHFLSFFDWHAATKGDVKVKGETLNKSKLKEIEILYPNLLPEQKRIVKVLDKVFEKAAKANENVEKNLQNARELFESYLQSVFGNPGNDWEEKRLEEIAEVFGGFAFKSNQFTKAGKYQVIRMGNVRPGLIRIDENPVFIDKIDEKPLSRSLLQRDDIIITQTGTRGKRDYGYTVAIDKDNYLLNQRLAAIRFPKKFNHRFFLHFSWSDKFRDQFFANETGTVGQGNVGIGAVTGALIPVPKIEEQNRIVAKLDAILLETKKLETIYQKKIGDLEELRKSILYKTFIGELAGAQS